MKLEDRIAALASLSEQLADTDAGWREAVARARAANAWFHPRFVERAARHIREAFLDRRALEAWAARYDIPAEGSATRSVGIVMAGNIPLVGMHDLLCAFLAGRRTVVKPSERDRVLVEYVVDRLRRALPDADERLLLAERLNGCDAYIATGSDNSARHFERYFAHRPHVIRRNRTSVAVLDGHETADELRRLADDVCTYYGLGCRNVTQVLVPEGYDFAPLLEALRTYEWMREEHKYRNNLDYQLTLLILNRRFYMSNDSTLLVEDPSPFSPIGVLHYRHYRPDEAPAESIDPARIQCIVGRGHTPFSRAQSPAIDDYADGLDTMSFLLSP
jgi:hypothetical protein